DGADHRAGDGEHDAGVEGIAGFHERSPANGWTSVVPAKAGTQAMRRVQVFAGCAESTAFSKTSMPRIAWGPACAGTTDVMFCSTHLTPRRRRDPVGARAARRDSRAARARTAG